MFPQGVAGAAQGGSGGGGGGGSYSASSAVSSRLDVANKINASGNFGDFAVGSGATTGAKSNALLYIGAGLAAFYIWKKM